MKKMIGVGVMSCAALAVTLYAAPPANAQKPDADKILQQMSAKLAAAQQFRFKARRTVDPALTSGFDMPTDAMIVVTVMRPDKLQAKSVSKDDTSGSRSFYADGENLSIYDEKKNLYTTVPMKATLDELGPKIDQKYGFTPPLIEIAASDLYKDLKKQADKVTYLGTAPASPSNPECYRLSLTGKVANATLLISVSDSLPVKLIATFKDRPGKPQLRVDYADWNLAATADAKDFVFTPPTGATKTTLMTVAKMDAARKKAHSASAPKGSKP